MSTVFTLNDAKRLAIRAITEKGGEYVNTYTEGGTCKYVETDPWGDVKAPSCIVGTGIHLDMGIELLTIANDCEGHSGEDAVMVASTTHTKITRLARTFLSTLQRDQDNQISWAKAYRNACQSVEYTKNKDPHAYDIIDYGLD